MTQYFSAEGLEKLKKELKMRIVEETGITPEIAKIGLKELLQRLGMETELKEKRIIDSREKI